MPKQLVHLMHTECTDQALRTIQYYQQNLKFLKYIIKP